MFNMQIQAECKCWQENRLDVCKQWVCAKIDRSCGRNGFRERNKRMRQMKRVDPKEIWMGEM
jgi:hypothetical protein